MYILPVKENKTQMEDFQVSGGEYCEKQLGLTVENFNSIYTMEFRIIKLLEMIFIVALLLSS